MSFQARDLLQRILVADPGSRPTFAEIKEHAFFSDIDWSMSLNDRYRSETAPFVPEAPSYNLDLNAPGAIENQYEPEKQPDQDFNMTPQTFHAYMQQNHTKDKPSTNGRRRSKPLGDFIFKKLN